MAVKDMAASVLMRLKKQVQETGLTYQMCLQLFCQELTHNKPLPIFNLLKMPGKSAGTSTRADVSKTKWNEMAKQLYEAIMILIVDWDAKPDTPLVALKKEAEKYRYCDPNLKRIEKVNNIIAKDYRKRKLSEILDDLRKSDNIKDYKFDLLDMELKKNKIVSNF